MNHAHILVRFFSFRTFLGLFAGVVVALIYVIFFRRSGVYTPLISLMIAIWISKLSSPKHLTGLAALIAIPVGLIAGIQFALEKLQTFDIPTMIGTYLGVSIFLIGYVLIFAFLGFFCGQLIRLYRKGALF
jgi:hypothetical protein